LRRIKVILVAVAATMTMTVLAAPAIAQDTTFVPAETTIGGDTFLGSGGFVTDGSGFVVGSPTTIDDFGDFFDDESGSLQFVISDPASTRGDVFFS
jgi:hypothetical protein